MPGQKIPQPQSAGKRKTKRRKKRTIMRKKKTKKRRKSRRKRGGVKREIPLNELKIGERYDLTISGDDDRTVHHRGNLIEVLGPTENPLLIPAFSTDSWYVFNKVERDGIQTDPERRIPYPARLILSAEQYTIAPKGIRDLANKINKYVGGHRKRRKSRRKKKHKKRRRSKRR